MTWALLSVSDKTGIADFARQLAESGYRLLASGGTGSLLEDRGIDYTQVSELTGFPEIMGGRVKTLHPRIHGGILARRDQDAELLAETNIPDIRLVVVNLYPFRETLAGSPDDHQAIIENIDIGGPTLIRAAAKNHRWVTVITDPQDYSRIAEEIQQSKDTSPDTRARLATEAFRHCADYDNAIYNWMAPRAEPNDSEAAECIQLSAAKALTLRYGENPHQQAAMYLYPGEQTSGWGSMQQHHGKPLSYNNIVDSELALRCVSDLDQSGCVIVKHANPCGVACDVDLTRAYIRAFEADSESAFGGIVAFNRPLDTATIKTIIDKQFVEVILAPELTRDVSDVLADKPNVRLVSLRLDTKNDRQLRSIAGGLLIQQNDLSEEPEHRHVAGPSPTEQQQLDLQQAWRIVRHIKSNAILLYSKGQTIGVGAGQTSRIQSLRIAVERARANGFQTRGAVLASDAFLPFADSVEYAAQHGISQIIQTGGSIRDDEIIAAADQHKTGMTFTDRRYFYH